MSGEVSRNPVSPLHLLRFHSGQFHCDEPGCKCREGLASTPIDRHPVIQRVPVTRNHIIEVMTGRFTCKIPGCPCIEASKHYPDALYESIYKFVNKIAATYSISCVEKQDDLAEICFERIVKNLHKYHPERCEFITWAGRVSINILLQEVKKSGRYIKVFDRYEPAHEHENVGDSRSNRSFLAGDIALAVEELRALYPKWHDVLDAIFGDDGRDFPSDLVVSDISRMTGRRYNEVHVFVTKTVRPFFINWFQPNGGIE